MKENYIPLKYDTEKINEDIPIRDAIKFYADELKSSGSNISCPSPNHNDAKPSAHIYGNKCKCFSCGETFTPITLAKAYNSSLSFPEVCKKILNDFGLSPYDYSNLREVESQRNAKISNTFYDCFPFTDKELEIIGIAKDQKKVEMLYPIKASDYFKDSNGNIGSWDLKRIYDENGKEKIFLLNRYEAIQKDIIDETDEKIKNNKIEDSEYIEIPSIREWWEDDKESIEQIMLNKCYEKRQELKDEIQMLTKDIEKFKSNYSIEEIKGISTLNKNYTNSLYAYMNNTLRGEKTEAPILTKEQRIKITELTNFETNKDIYRENEKTLKEVNYMVNKLLKQQHKRKEQYYKSYKKAEPKKTCWDLKKDEPKKTCWDLEKIKPKDEPKKTCWDLENV